VVVDPKGPGPARYHGATVLKPNLSELADMTDRPVATTAEVVDAGRQLADELAGTVVLVTCGPDGMVLFRAGAEPLGLPAAATRRVYDVTGAGDTVAAVLTLGGPSHQFGGQQYFFGASLPFPLPIIIAGLILNTIFLVREIRRNEQQDSFLNTVTHELKTPIASIRLYLETLQRRAVDPEKAREFYALMLADTDRLMGTVDQVLKAGALGQKGLVQNVLEVDLNQMVQQCTELVRARYGLPEQSLTLRPAAEGVIVMGNPEELRSALTNVLDNAVKYSPNGAQLTVVLSVESDAWVMVSVADQGLGIPQAQLKRIFRRFYRVPNRNILRVKGTGLGLFLVRSIARQHGGDAFAESKGEGRGSTFTIRLPRVYRV